MKESIRKWIDLAKIISINPFVKIKCPECKESFLEIHIIPWQNDEAKKLDIHIICNNCKAKNIITKDLS